jgi:hypothetical protein
MVLQPLLILAQISPKVARKFPAHIVFMIDEVADKVNLSEDQQIKMAQNFVAIDSMANAGLFNAENVKELKANYKMSRSFLKNILSAEQLDQYDYELDKDNRFLTALKFTQELKLQPQQISLIRKLNDSVYYLPKAPSKQSIQFSNKKLHSILAKEQYIALLKQVYKEQSIADASEDWQRITKIKLNTPGKEMQELQMITDYELTKNSLLDKKADRYEKKERDLLAKKAALMEPFLLIRANILSDGVYANNKYASVIQYETELNLSKSQTDSLLAGYIAFEKIKLENKANELKNIPVKKAPSEYENIGKILNTEQVGKWLVSKNRTEGIKTAQESWNNLESEGLTKNLDKKKTIEDLAVYHIKYLVTYERAKIYKTQENIFAKRDIEQRKPDLLKQLDAIAKSKSKNSAAKNALAW